MFDTIKDDFIEWLKSKCLKGIFCDICGNYIEPNKDLVYEVSKTKYTLVENDKYNAIDCPRCGCQIILKKRV